MTRRQPAELRRQRILESAAGLLIREGLEATSMDAIAATAGIAKGTVYLYFPSRAGLLAALRQQYAQELANRARSALRREAAWTAPSLAAAVRRMVPTLLDYLLANRRLHHVLFQEAGVSEEETMAPLRDLLRQTLQKAMGDGALEVMDADTLMRFLLDGLHGALLPLLHESRPGRKRVLGTLDDMVQRLLAPTSCAVP